MEDTIQQDRLAPSDDAARRSAMGALRSPMVLSVCDQMVISAASFFVSVVVGRTLGSDALGVYSLGFSIGIFCLGVQTALVSTPWTIYRARVGHDAEAMPRAGSALVMSLGVSLASAAALLVAASSTFVFSPDSPLLPVLLVLAVVMPFFMLREFGRRFEFARMSMSSALRWDAATVTLQIGGLIGLTMIDALSTLRVFGVLGAACFITSFSWFVSNFHKLFRFVGSQLKHDVLYSSILGRWVLVENLLWTGAFFSLHWILYGTMTARETGILAACASLAGLLSPIFQGIGNYLSPHIASVVATESRESTFRLVYHTVAKLLLVTFCFSCFLFMFGDFLISVLYSNKHFAGYGYVAGMLAIRIGVLTVRVPLLHTLIAMQRPRLAAVSSGAGLLTTIVLGIGLGQILGLFGVVLAGIVGVVVDVLVIEQFVRKQFAIWVWTEDESKLA